MLESQGPESVRLELSFSFKERVAVNSIPWG